MTQMFEDFSYLHTVKNGKGNRYGVPGGQIRFGYIPNMDAGKNFEVVDIKKDLDQSLVEINCSYEQLPVPAQEALNQADGYSLVVGIAPKGYQKDIPVANLVSTLESHPQMVQSLELCSIFIVVNGKIYQDKPLSLPDIPPMKGSEAPRIIAVPDTLPDPLTETKISTTNKGEFSAGQLVLKTSESNMRRRRAQRHIVSYKAQSGHVGYIAVSELDVQSSFRDNIYGVCMLGSLEEFKQNERAQLAKSPLTRAVNAFISRQVEAYAKEFEARERRQVDQEERIELSKINEALNRWKDRTLSELLHSLWGIGKGGPDIPPPPPLPAGKPIRIELSLSHAHAGIGVSFRPKLHFFDKSGARIRPVAFRWASDDANVALVDEDLGIINTFAPGSTFLYAKTLDRKLKSNKVPLEVVHIRTISITPKTLELQVGSREKLEALCTLSGGTSTNDVYLLWTENNSSVARVSSSGLVFGFSVGETEVVAEDDKAKSISPALIKVIEREEGKTSGDKHGKGFPLILVSEIDSDPETKESVVFRKDEPSICQRPQDVDRNIWWINTASPMAKMYLRKYGAKSQAWRMYHIERFIDVMVQIALTSGPDSKESLSVSDWIQQWGTRIAEIHPLVASSLAEFIDVGELPESN